MKRFAKYECRRVSRSCFGPIDRGVSDRSTLRKRGACRSARKTDIGDRVAFGAAQAVILRAMRWTFGAKHEGLLPGDPVRSAAAASTVNPKESVH
jgi:hypothetical protein